MDHAGRRPPKVWVVRVTPTKIYFVIEDLQASHKGLYTLYVQHIDDADRSVIMLRTATSLVNGRRYVRDLEGPA